jgi:hypothetical protein
MARRALLWIFGWAALGCRGGSGLEELPIQAVTGPDQVVPQGVVARTPHFDMQVSSPTECERSGPNGAGRRVGVLVTLQARGALQVPANPYYALLVDAQNIVREPTLGGCAPELSSTLLEAPQLVRGWINFEVPRGAGDFLLAYGPPLTTGDREEVTFRLSPLRSARR